MSTEKLKAELEKANRLAAVWQARAKELERRIREQENMEIVQAVRSIAATPEELRKVLGLIKDMKEVPSGGLTGEGVSQDNAGQNHTSPGNESQDNEFQNNESQDNVNGISDKEGNEEDEKI